MQSTSTTEFFNLPLAKQIQDNLHKLNFSHATPIQTACISPAIEGKDIIGIAQTGTGKTLAFGLPILHRLLAGQKQALIVVPTRELALQVEESLRRVSQSLSIKLAVLIGGASMGAQKHAIFAHPHIIIATPGRLIDHLKQRTLTLAAVSMLVLDEADRMFDMGFAPQVEQILSAVPENRQTMLFSATMPEGIAQMIKKHMRLPVRIEIAPQGSIADKLTQEVFVVRGGTKSQLLEKLLAEYSGTVLVFMRTKHAAKRISNLIRAMGHSSVELHSNRTLGQRTQAMQGFKNGRYRVLVATDIAARGIDVSNIELVINYDLPENAEDYVHRIGRTGRAGQAGKAISFAAPDQLYMLKKIERLTRSRLPQSPLPKELPVARVVAKESFSSDRFSSGERSSSFNRRGGNGGFPRRSFDRDRSSSNSYSKPNNVWTKASTSDDKVMPSDTQSQEDRPARSFSDRKSNFSGSRDRRPSSRSSFGRSSSRFSKRDEGASSEGASGERRSSFPRRSFGDRKPGGFSQGASRYPRKTFGDKKEGGGSYPRRSFGDKRESGSSTYPRRNYGDRKEGGFSSDRFTQGSGGSPRRSYGSNQRRSSSSANSFSQSSGERKPFRPRNTRRGTKRPGNE